MKTSEERDELGNISIDKDLEGDSEVVSENNIDKDLEGDSEVVSENNIDKIIEDDTNMYKFGWSSYSEITNGRFAMIGFLAIILIELFSQQSFLKWAGIL